MGIILIHNGPNNGVRSDLAKFEAVMILPLKTNHSPAGLFIAGFGKTRDAERWINSELLVFFCQYAAQILENARLLEEVKGKTQKVRASYKIEVEEQIPALETIPLQPITTQPVLH